MSSRENKQLAKIIVIAFVLGVLLIGYGIWRTNQIDFAQSYDIVEEPVQRVPDVNQEQSVSVTVNSTPYRGLHDLTPVEWEGLKGIYGKDKLLIYLQENPNCSLSDAVLNVDGFGEMSAKIIDDYIQSINK